jgi:succinate dehydrogenase/fumarate reductase cytochrome b subunit
MSIEIGGIFGFLLLLADLWAIVSTLQSGASTQAKVLWIALILVLPLLGFLAWLVLGPKSAKTAA